MPSRTPEESFIGIKAAGPFGRSSATNSVWKQASKRSENLPSTYFNTLTNMLLIVYVDDMKLVGPTEHMASPWAQRGKKSWKRQKETRTIRRTHSWVASSSAVDAPLWISAYCGLAQWGWSKAKPLNPAAPSYSLCFCGPPDSVLPTSGAPARTQTSTTSIKLLSGLHNLWSCSSSAVDLVINARSQSQNHWFRKGFVKMSADMSSVRAWMKLQVPSSTFS